MLRKTKEKEEMVSISHHILLFSAKMYNVTNGTKFKILKFLITKLFIYFNSWFTYVIHGAHTYGKCDAVVGEISQK